MGFLSFTFFVFLPSVSLCTVAAFRLGKELPKVTRKTGRNIGMGYNYLKIFLKHLTPRSTHGVDLIRKMRQTGQQAFAFSNEVKLNLVEAGGIVKTALPDLTEDPFNKFGIQKEPSETVKTSEVTQVLRQVMIERQRIIDKKAIRDKEEATANKL